MRSPGLRFRLILLVLSFSFECRGCTRMKELEVVDLEDLRLLVVAVVQREQVGGANASGGGTVDDKVSREMLG